MPRPVEANPKAVTRSCRLTAAEALAVDEAARAAGLSVSAYIHQQLTGAPRRRPVAGTAAGTMATDASAFHAVRALGVELVRQGKNLNQITHRLNQAAQMDPASVTPPPELAAVLAEIAALLDKIRPALTKALT